MIGCTDLKLKLAVDATATGRIERHIACLTAIQAISSLFHTLFGAVNLKRHQAGQQTDVFQWIAQQQTFGRPHIISCMANIEKERFGDRERGRWRETKRILTGNARARDGKEGYLSL